ncbi:MAG: DUF998 domain-containing protein [Candidatus Izemoplasmatales bacterium]|nr:DUF998 domain-containing protein [Candidatus Izemoplasmatales bacterium]
MEQLEFKRYWYITFALLGIIGVVMYLLHIIIGNILYDGYEPLRQAISDLTSESSPVRDKVLIFTSIHGCFINFFCFGLLIINLGRVNKLVSLAYLLFFIMNFISFVGYSFFPLSEEGYAGTFSDVMHLVVTGLVVVLSLGSLGLFFFGYKKEKDEKMLAIGSIVALVLMFVGAILTFSLPESLLGLSERISIYSLQIFTVLLAVRLLIKKPTVKASE